MSTENQSNDTNQNQEEVITKTEVAEVIPSMDEFKTEIDHSFKKINPGDLLKGTVIGITDSEVTLDFGYYAEGIIRLEDYSNDPDISLKSDVSMGEEVNAMVIREDDGQGNLLLSKKRADDILAWDQLVEFMDNKKIVSVKISQAVKGGVITYLLGIRAFIPASHLSLSYVEDLSDWVGKTIDVIIITASQEDHQLVLSGKEVERARAIEDKRNKISKLSLGVVTTGIVEKIVPYGAFVKIGDGLSGLVHISQISWKRIKSPNEVIKEGDEVTVKIIDMKEGKISLSIKAVEEKEEVVEDVEEAETTYQTGEEVTTSLSSLLNNLKLD